MRLLCEEIQYYKISSQTLKLIIVKPGSSFINVKDYNKINVEVRNLYSDNCKYIHIVSRIQLTSDIHVLMSGWQSSALMPTNVTVYK